MSLHKDIFYVLKKPSVVKIKKIFLWADKHGEKTCVDMLNCNISWSRVKSDKSFSEVLKLMDKHSSVFFRVILRRQMNLFLILSYEKDIRDILEIVVCGIKEGQIEYFIRVYMSEKKLEVLLTMEELLEI